MAILSFVEFEHYSLKQTTTEFLPRDQKPDEIQVDRPQIRKEYRSASARQGRPVCWMRGYIVDALSISALICCQGNLPGQHNPS